MTPTFESNRPAAEPTRLELKAVLLDESFARGAGLVDFHVLFGNRRPVELEIGTGKGTFLLHQALARPEVNFFGLEWARQYCLYAADRACRWGAANIRMLRTDAAAFVERRIPDGSLWRVHIYFPDPWPKTRHLKRRLIRPPFVALLHRKLALGGQLAVITDHRDYARQIAWTVFAQRGFASVPMPRTDLTGSGEMVGTNFERKYITQGRRFHSLVVIKWR